MLIYWGVAATLTPGLDWQIVSRYIAFEIGWVMVPGVAVLAWAGVPMRGVLWWPLAWSAGSGILIAAMLFSGAVGTFWLTQLVPLIGLMASYLYRGQLRAVLPSTLRPALPLPLMIAALALLLGFEAVKGRVVLPLGTSPYSFINQDVLWNMGITLSLERGFPPEDFQAAGMPFGYHYLHNAWLAGAHMASTIPLETLVLRANPLSLIITLLLGGYACARQFGLRRNQATLAATLPGVFMHSESNVLLSSVFYESGGFAFSLTCLVGLWLIIPWMARKGRPPLRAAGPFVLAAVSAAGSKFVGVPLMFASLGVGLYGARKHRDLQVRLTGIMVLLGFAVTIAWFVISTGARSGGQLELFPFYTLREQRWAEFSWAHQLPRPLIAVLYVVHQYWPLFALGWVFLKHPTSSLGRVLRMAAIAFVLGGVAISLTFGHVGSSHLYFEGIAMVAVPFLTVLSHPKAGGGWLRFGWALTVALFTVVGLGNWHQFRASTLSWQGTRNTPAADFADDSVSALQLQALEYLRTKTSPDSVIMANRQVTWPGYFRYYYNTAISERRAFLAGPDYSPYGNLSRLYNRLGIAPVRTPYYVAMEQRANDNHYFFESKTADDARERLCPNRIVTHVLLDLQVLPGLAFPTDGLLTELFRNEHSIVYAVTGCGDDR